MATTDKKNKLSENAAKLYDSLQKREDYWINQSTGVGTDKDRHRNMQQFRSARPTDEELEAYYVDNDIAATIVDRVPEEGMRQGYTLKFEGEKLGEAAEIVRWGEEKYSVGNTILQADKWARLFGGAAVLYGADNIKSLEEPLTEGYEVEFIRPVARTDMDTALWYNSEEDVLTNKYGKPEVFRTTFRSGGASASPTPIHESRFHIIQGVLSTQRRFIENDGWGDSVLTRVIDILKRFDGSWISVMHILTDSSVPVYKIKDLMSLLESDQIEALLSRMSLIDQSKNNLRPIVLDADGESYERVASQLTDVASVLQNSMVRMSGAAKLPVSILFGQAPAGLNASPEGDLRNLYDKVDVERKEKFGPALLAVYSMLLSQKTSPTKGRVPKGLTVEFPSLWQADPIQAATLYQMMSTADGVYIANQVMDPEEVAVFRAETAQPFGFPRIETELRKDLLDSLNNADALAETLPSGMPGGKNLPSNAVRRRGVGPDTAEEGGAPTGLTVETEPQKASLSGGQIKAIQDLVQTVASGTLPTSAAKSIILASFPIEQAAVDAIFADVDDVYEESTAQERAELRAMPFGGLNPGNDGVEEEGGDENKEPEENEEEASAEVPAQETDEEGEEEETS